jgi:zeaxanthin glucosyltransferase
MTAAPLLVALLPETGHLNPSFKLLRALQKRGHDVRYVVPGELAAYVERQGFAVEPFLPELASADPPAEAGKLALLRRRRAITARFRAVSERLASRGPLAFGARPALALVDVTQTQLALWARFSGIPLVLINTSLPQTKAPGVAPLRSGRAYAPDAWGRVWNELEWRRFLLKRRVSGELAAALDMCPPYLLARQLAPRFGVPAGELDSQTVYMPQLRGVPELVLCPEALDFPRPPAPERHFIESLDLAREEAAFDWDRLSADKPLVYCALGGQLYRARDTPRFLQRVVAAFARRPELQLVLATGQYLRPEQLGPLPPNVLVLERAPQLTLLKRARAMITHGGLGSVKECVAHAVPMLVFPLDVDQPGNAARVAYHGLGLVGDVAKTSAKELSRMLDRVLNESAFAARCAVFREDFLRFERGSRGADLVEGFLREPGRQRRGAGP